MNRGCPAVAFGRASTRILPCVSLATHLKVLSPLGLAFQQGIQHSPAWLAVGRVIPTDHIVGCTHSAEEVQISSLTTAVIWDVGKIHIHRGAGTTLGAQRCCGDKQNALLKKVGGGSSGVYH